MLSFKLNVSVFSLKMHFFLFLHNNIMLPEGVENKKEKRRYEYSHRNIFPPSV